MISCVISQAFLLALSTHTWQSGSPRPYYGRDGKDEYRAAGRKTGYGGAGLQDILIMRSFISLYKKVNTVRRIAKRNKNAT